MVWGVDEVWTGVWSGVCLGKARDGSMELNHLRMRQDLEQSVSRLKPTAKTKARTFGALSHKVWVLKSQAAASKKMPLT